MTTPKLKKRTDLLTRLKVVFRSLRSQPVQRVITMINPILRGWVNYFAHGNASDCFSYVRDWLRRGETTFGAKLETQRLRLEEVE